MFFLLVWVVMVVAVVVFPPDKKSKMSPGQTLILLAAVAIGGGLIGILTTVNRTQLYQTYEQRGVAVTAAVSNLTVERRGSGKSSSTHYLIDLRYRTAQRAAVDLRHETSAEVYNELKVGATFPLLYLPESPKTVVLHREIQLWRGGARRDTLLASTIGMVLGFGLLAGMLKLRQRFRPAPANPY
ncbi:MAG TPA: DUF3592 domain-containing protein [Herpetosiphonaceae bacterium]